MMTRDFCVYYLTTQECYPDDTCDVEGVGQLWRHGTNGHVCFVPYDEELVLGTYCHIFYELKVDPPQENGYDSDYAVYSSFRAFHEKQLATKNKEP